LQPTSQVTRLEVLTAGRFAEEDRLRGFMVQQHREFACAVLVDALGRLLSLFLAAESAHWVTGIAAFILLADIGDQRCRALHLNFEGSDQRIFRVNDSVFRLPLNL
jgi:hypothetical protein